MTPIPAASAFSVTFIWFLMYWILGGVFFAALGLWQFRRVRHVRFSCLYTLFALIVAVVASRVGLRFGHEAIAMCLLDAKTYVKTLTAMVGCGFSSLFMTFIIGIAALLLGGGLLMWACRARVPLKPRPKVS